MREPQRSETDVRERRPLRIGVDVREWERDSSTGIARFLTGFLSWAADEAPHELHLYANQHTELRVEGRRVVPHRLDEGRRFFWDQVALPRHLRRQRIDVFLSPYYKMPLLAPCPVVVTLHDLIPLRFPDYAGADGAVRSGLRRLWIQLMAERADRIVTDSEHARRDLVDALGVAEERVDVVPVPLPPALARPPGPDEVQRVRRQLDLPDAYVLYVGRHDPHKNVQTLVRAFLALEASLQARYPLVLAGRGGAESAPDRPHVRAAGFVADERLAGLYGGARAFAFPSRYEGFGLPPLEAMGCGVPVVCSDAAALPEVVGDAALLLPPEDVAAWTAALRRLLVDEELRRRLIAAGRARASQFTPPRVAPRLLAALERACGRPPGRSRP